MKINTENFKIFMDKFKPLDVKIRDKYTKMGRIIRTYTVQNEVVAFVVKWKYCWINP